MKNRICQIFATGVVSVLLSGCASVPDTTGYKEIVLVVTSDQKFVIGDTKVGVADFYEKVSFNRSALNVMFSVDKKSLVQESTMIELIKIFKDKGYSVIMAPGSKYPDAVSKTNDKQA